MTSGLHVHTHNSSPRGGIVRTARRPEGWQAPGPLPAGNQDRDELWPAAGEDLCFLSGEWRIFQRLKGHRWSLDDLVTAWCALETVRDVDVTRAMDLGCGIGSVLMMTAWRLPTTPCVGIEAQDVSVDLARRSIAYNGIESHVHVRRGDLRDPSMTPEGPIYDLVTGTPPYIPIGHGSVSEHPQCGPCRHEFRGGIEDYCDAAARLMSPSGRFVTCAGGGQTQRTETAAEAAGLQITRRRDIIPIEGRDCLFSVYSMVHDRREPGPLRLACQVEEPLIVRDGSGARTPGYVHIREAMGMPP